MTRKSALHLSMVLILLATVTVLTAKLVGAQESGGVTGIWKQCSGAGYLVLLEGGQQVNVVGMQVEVGTYTFDGRRVGIATKSLYGGQGFVQAVTTANETMPWYAYDPQAATLTAGEQCYTRLPGQ
jgi:hypothetical protein